MLLFQVGCLYAQDVPYHISNEQVYNFLEEMATLKKVQLNNVVLPLSRGQISEYLLEVAESSGDLNKRQEQELYFYLQEFIKETSYQGFDFLGKGLRSGDVFPLRKRQKRIDLLHFKNKLFNVTVNPIYGGEGVASGEHFSYQYSLGARLFGSVSDYFSFYAELRDNSDSEVLSDPAYLQRRMGVNYKVTLDYSEMRGGIRAHTKWGSVALVKDHIEWGSNYNGSNIFSGRTPSFPMVKMDLNPVDWFSFHYLHAWLVSDVTDSIASYTVRGSGYREIFRSKYLAANMMTFRPLKGLFISAGNSIVYGDQFNPVYLIPFLFYKSVDHTLNSTGSNSNFGGQNSQMFLNIMSRQIKYTQLYFSFFVDEVRLSELTSSTKSKNHFSYKAGVRFTSPGNVNLSLVFEYTRTNPMAYKHFVPVTTFESNSYNLGHHLRDNAEEYFGMISYRPLSRLLVRATMSYVRKGEEYDFLAVSNGVGRPFIESMKMNRIDLNFRLSYSVAHDVNVFGGYQYLKESGVDAYSYLPDRYSLAGPHHFRFGMSFGY